MTPPPPGSLCVSQGCLLRRAGGHRHLVGDAVVDAHLLCGVPHAGPTVPDRVPGVPAVRLLCPHHGVLRIGGKGLCSIDSAQCHGFPPRFPNGSNAVRKTAAPTKSSPTVQPKAALPRTASEPVTPVADTLATGPLQDYSLDTCDEPCCKSIHSWSNNDSVADAKPRERRGGAAALAARGAAEEDSERHALLCPTKCRRSTARRFSNHASRTPTCSQNSHRTPTCTHELHLTHADTTSTATSFVDSEAPLAHADTSCTGGENS